jgi:hypothetical protein
MFLTGTELAAMRGDVLDMLPGTAIIQSAANSSDGAGGWTETWTAVTGGTVACRIDPFKRLGNIETAGSEEALNYSYQLTLPYNAPIEPGNRVQINGTAYEVRSLFNEHDWNVSKRAQITRIR